LLITFPYETVAHTDYGYATKEQGINIMSNTLTVTLVNDSSGSIDQAASRAAFETALARHTAEVETQGTLIEEAVSALFDQYKDTAIGMPALGSMTAQRLGGNPDNFKVLSERTLNHVRANADGKGRALYTISKGKGGGVRRVSA
jgi:hypothetical protein